MKIATWNVNSIKARLPRVQEWLGEFQPDVALLQELKCVEENFPRMEIEDLGYNIAVSGQKTYNGVAILSKEPLEDISARLPGDEEDSHARYLEATTFGIRIACLYLPNGNPAPGPKFDYKLAWMERLRARAAHLLASEMPVVLGGDFNVIPQDIDCYDPAGWEGDALTRDESRAAFSRICHDGYVDAIRSLHPSEVMYSYWDYQAGAWQKDNGVRIDHLLLSPEAADRLAGAGVDRGPRGLEKPSDHTPVWVELAA